MVDKRGLEVEQIPVRISYDFIRLFSEGLYKNPHKAVEELVSNSYDADATNVRIVLPKGNPADTRSADPTDSLWVIDDGSGMDVAGFRDLWSVAESKKQHCMNRTAKRLPIGQFGIGKLASYVLAWKLTYISRVESRFLATEMDFRKIARVKQNSNSDPVTVSLVQIGETTAISFLSEIETRDPTAWESLFGKEAHTSSWTATRLSDFRDIYERLNLDHMRWALNTGFPLQSEFKVWIDGKLLQSSKERPPRIKEIRLGSAEDTVANELGFTVQQDSYAWAEVPEIGRVSGRLEVFQDSLEARKSEPPSRSHGFFIRVRGRVINLEDEFFGIPPQYHPAWVRFVLDVDADGLHYHLLSSREGVKEFEGLNQLREYLHGLFNLGRSAYESWVRRQAERSDLTKMLSNTSSVLITEPLIDTLKLTIKTGNDSFYMRAPRNWSVGGCKEWLASTRDRIRKTPFKDTGFEGAGFHAPALRYFPESQEFCLNTDHPFVGKLIESGRYKDSATLFGLSELLIKCQLHERGLSTETIRNFLRDRDRILRLLAGHAPLEAAEVLRQLAEAKNHPIALEHVVGTAFHTLGFEHQRNSGHASGLDGILYAKLGKLEKSTTSDRLVYILMQTDQDSVPADNLDFSALESFRSAEDAKYGFFIAYSYAGELDPNSRLNEVANSTDNERITMLKIEHLDRLIRLHYRHGLTLTELHKIFARSRTVIDVNNSLSVLKDRLDQHEIPLRNLLDGLEELKSDRLAVPNYNVARTKSDSLMSFAPERLGASLRGLASILDKRWLEVDEYSGHVIMHKAPHDIIETLNDRMTELALLD